MTRRMLTVEDGVDFYEIIVGGLKVTVDFKAEAVSVSRTDLISAGVVTEELGNGFLIDRCVDTKSVLSVEVLL